MWILTTILLAGALLYLLRRQLRERRLIRSLAQAIERRRPLLQEEEPGAELTALGRAVNELLAEARQLEHQRQGQLAQLEATLGSLQEAVLIVDARNRVVLANRALQAIFPRAQNILDQRLEVVLSNPTFLRTLEAVRADAAQPQQEIEFTEGGQRRWIEATGAKVKPLHGPHGPWVLFVLHDISKQKRLELVRKEFVANVSHELRTPLSVIKGYVETLAEGHESMPLSDRTRFLETIHRHTARLNSLLDDLLTLSRLESSDPGLRLERVSLATLIQEVVDDFRHRPAVRGHELVSAVPEDLGPLSLDPLKLTQVFENLLGNALKYSPEGSRVTLSARRQGGEVVVTVADTGPGIPAEDLPHIFERFYRVEKGRSRDKGGTGLGLSIVKHIVQLHGGRVWAESTLGQGSTFFLTLPAGAATS